MAHVAVIKGLVSSASTCSDVNARGIYGNTALHVAANISTDALATVLAILIGNGADPSIRNCSGQTAVSSHMIDII